jgi:hypothetical protein
VDNDDTQVIPKAQATPAGRRFRWTRGRIITAVVAGTAAVVVAGSVAFAASRPPVGRDDGGTYHFCAAKGGVVSVNGTLNDSKCPTGSYAFAITPGQPGPMGPQGPAGPAGNDGKNAQALPYGIAQILVARGSGSATVWDQPNTTLGSPVGDTASGAFRFTCSTANAPCKLSVKAYATASGYSVYPRVDISKDDLGTGNAVGNCEYGDGIDNNGGTQALTSSPSDVTLGIGGTLDCGASQTYPTNGVATEIDVPAGYYDVVSEFTFSKTG